MLVITRGVNESVRIFVGGVEVGSVQVCRVRGDNVRLGFDFPLEFKILRDEIDYSPQDETEERTE